MFTDCFNINYWSALTPGLELLNPRPLARGRLRSLIAGITESRQNFSALPGVAVELNQIKSEVPTRQLLNQQFTSAALKDEVESFSAPVVHLASHAQFGSKAEDTFILTWNARVDVNELNILLQNREINRSGAIELLVLSACQTAAGDKRAALGLAGLAYGLGHVVHAQLTLLKNPRFKHPYYWASYVLVGNWL